MAKDISETCTCVQVRDVPEGGYFKLAPTDTSPVWVRGEYIRGEKKYECYRADDICHFAYYKSNRYVYINFIY